MTFRLILRQKCFTRQISLLESTVRAVQSLQFLRLCCSTELNQSELEISPERKILKVAIVGRPNAGKSTLINSILDLNICGVSRKTHTTKSYIKAAFTRGDTQVVFVDTPGLVTQKEYFRFNLSKDFLNWKTSVLEEADIIGVVHEVTGPKHILKFHLNLVQQVQSFPETKPLFLVLNKIDLIKDKKIISATLEGALLSQNLNTPAQKTPKILRKFSKVFCTSALEGKGVEEIVQYLLEEARPGNWILEPDVVSDKPLHLIITDLLRAQLLNYLPHQMPYECKYEIEYLKENDLGEIICVALVTCNRSQYLDFITRKKKFILRQLSKDLESDLYKILKKVFRIRVVVVSSQKEKK